MSGDPTAAQLRVLAWLAENPGQDVFDYYDEVGPYVRGLELVSRRGAAGRMRHRLWDDGFIASGRDANGYRVAELTDAGRTVLARHDPAREHGIPVQEETKAP